MRSISRNYEIVTARSARAGDFEECGHEDDNAIEPDEIDIEEHGSESAAAVALAVKAIYGFILEEMDGTHLDSCYGFYDPESMMAHASDGLEDGDKLKVVGLDYFIAQKHMPAGVELVDEFDEESEAEEQEAWNCRA